MDPSANSTASIIEPRATAFRGIPIVRRSPIKSSRDKQSAQPMRITDAHTSPSGHPHVLYFSDLLFAADCNQRVVIRSIDVSFRPYRVTGCWSTVE
jgi:hypothetical protein